MNFYLCEKIYNSLIIHPLKDVFFSSEIIPNSVIKTAPLQLKHILIYKQMC